MQGYVFRRIVTSQVAGFKHRIAQLEFRQEGFETEFVVQVVIMAGDASLAYHSERQLQRFGDAVGVFDGKEQGEVVFFHLLFFLRRVDQSRYVTLESIHKARHNRFKRIGSGHVPIQDV